MSIHDRYRGPEDPAARIPVFPLTGAILLPRATLPLNVFEPRYLAMIDNAIGGERLVGIIQPETGESGIESPVGKAAALKRVGCAGRITSFQEVDDGRMIITLTGIARFEVLREALVSMPYRVFDVSYGRFASDFDRGAGEDAVDREHLLRVLRAYLVHNGIEMDWQAIGRASTEYLINALSIMSPYGPEEKQALLEAHDLKARADVLTALAEMEIAGRGRAGGGTLQ